MQSDSAQLVAAHIAAGRPIRESPLLEPGTALLIDGVLHVSTHRLVEVPIARPKPVACGCSTRASKSAGRRAYRAWRRRPFATVTVPFGVDGFVEHLNGGKI